MSSNIKKNFGENLKKLRKFKDITASQLADAIDLDLRVLKSYEIDGIMAPSENLIKLANYFKVSIDFLILQKNTPYIKSIELIELGDKIDKLNFNERYNVEGTANALIGKKKVKTNFKYDLEVIELTTSFHKNIKALRKIKGITQLEIAKILNVSDSQIVLYEHKGYPKINNLIKIANYFNISINALLTGKKLIYNFNNKDLQNTIFQADQLLSLEDKKVLIHLMHRIIENTEQ